MVTGNTTASGVSFPAIGSIGLTCNASQLQLTTTWTVMAGYEHFWTPTFKSSFAAGYTAVEYNNTAKAMFAQNVCAPVAIAGSSGVITGGGQGQFNGGNVGITSSAATSAAPSNNLANLATGRLSIADNCDPDWGFFQGGVPRNWNVSPGFFLGLDVFYTRVFTAFQGTQANLQGVAFGTS